MILGLRHVRRVFNVHRCLDVSQGEATVPGNGGIDLVHSLRKMPQALADCYSRAFGTVLGPVVCDYLNV